MNEIERLTGILNKILIESEARRTHNRDPLYRLIQIRNLSREALGILCLTCNGLGTEDGEMNCGDCGGSGRNDTTGIRRFRKSAGVQFREITSSE